MNETQMQATVIVDRPADLVWSVVADYERDPEWRAGVTTMAPSAPGVVTPGVRTDEVLRFAGRTYRNGGVVEAVVPGRRFTWRTTSGVDASGARAVEALPDGTTRVTLVLDARLRGPERLLRPVLRRRLAADAERLAALLASPAVAV